MHIIEISSEAKISIFLCTLIFLNTLCTCSLTHGAYKHHGKNTIFLKKLEYLTLIINTPFELNLADHADICYVEKRRTSETESEL